METPTCCHLGCDRATEWVVWEQDPRDPYAGTEACTEHLGPLLAMSDLPARVKRA